MKCNHKIKHTKRSTTVPSAPITVQTDTTRVLDAPFEVHMTSRSLVVWTAHMLYSTSIHGSLIVRAMAWSDLSTSLVLTCRCNMQLLWMHCNDVYVFLTVSMSIITMFVESKQICIKDSSLATTTLIFLLWWTWVVVATADLVLQHEPSHRTSTDIIYVIPSFNIMCPQVEQAY